MARQSRYPQELRERSVRMVFDHTREYESEWAAIRSIAAKVGVNKETLRIWVRRAQVDAGLRPGLSTEERERLRQLERENRELRRANEILKSASPPSSARAATLAGGRPLAGQHRPEPADLAQQTQEVAVLVLRGNLLPFEAHHLDDRELEALSGRRDHAEVRA